MSDREFREEFDRISDRVEDLRFENQAMIAEVRWWLIALCVFVGVSDLIAAVHRMATS